jgi:hypothetical protein
VSYRKYKFGGNDWIEIVPERRFSVFEFDSKVEGAVQTPKILFNRKEATFTFKENAICYSNFPSTYEFLIFPFLAETSFKEKIIQRAEVLKKIKKHIVSISEDFENISSDIEYCLTLIKTWKDHNTIMLPYMFLALSTDEIILNSFQDIMYSEKKHLATNVFTKVFNSKFAKSAQENNSFIPTLREFSIPPSTEIPDVVFPEATTNELENTLENFYSLLKNESETFKDKFINTHEVLGKLQYEMTEENYYVWQTYAILINHILYHTQLSLSKTMNLTSDLTNCTISQIESLIKLNNK